MVAWDPDYEVDNLVFIEAEEDEDGTSTQSSNHSAHESTEKSSGDEAMESGEPAGDRDVEYEILEEIIVDGETVELNDQDIIEEYLEEYSEIDETEGNVDPNGNGENESPNLDDSYVDVG